MKATSSSLLSLKPLMVVCSVACTAMPASAQSTWALLTNGQWGNAPNWTAGVPNAAGAIANIDTAVTVAVSDTGTAGTYPYQFGRLSTSLATGAVVIGDPAVSSDVLTAAIITGNPTINVNTGASLFYYANLEGAQGFEKTGGGRLTWRFNNNVENFTGPIRITGGTLGINQESNLGPSATNGLFIANAAKLIAEPGSNAGTVTLTPARAITLTGALPQFGASAAAINLLIQSSISDGGSGFGIDKTDAGIVTLAGTNSWTGPARVSAGVLSAATPAALPGFGTQAYAVTGTSTLAVRYGDASPWTQPQINQLLTNPGVVFATGASFGIDTTGNTLDATLPGNLTSLNFAKVGPGTLVLQDPQTIVKTLVLYGGTLGLTPTTTLPTGMTFRNLASGTTFDLGGTTVSAINLDEITGGTTTLTNGSLTYTGGNITFGGNNGTNLNLSGLTAYTHSTTGTELKLEAANNANGTLNTVQFASGTNTFTLPTRFIVGGGPSLNTGPHIATARLGTTNVINSGLVQLGAFNAAGTLNFQDGLTNPTLTLRAANGTSPMPFVRIGETSSGGRSGAGILDLAGGTADILATDIILGRHIAGSSNGDTSSISLENGRIEALRLLMAEKTSSGAPAINARFTQLAGAVVIDSIVMVQTGPSAASPPVAASAVQNLRSIYDLVGGNLTTSEIKAGVTVPAITSGTTLRSLRLAGGTLTSKATSDLTITGISVDVPLLSPATITAPSGRKVLLASGTTYTAHLDSSALTTGSLLLNGTMELSAAVLTVTDDAAGGGSTLPPGTKLVLINHTNGTLTGTFAGLTDGSALTVGSNDFILRYNDTMGGTGRFVTLTVPVTGDPFAAFMDGFYPGSTDPADIGFTADPDKDGIANAIEFVTGGDPKNSSSSPLLPTVTADATSITFTYRRTAASAYLNPRVEIDTDLLGVWTTAANGVGGVTVLTTPDGFGPGVDRIDVTVPRSPDSRKYLRLAVNPAS